MSIKLKGVKQAKSQNNTAYKEVNRILKKNNKGRQADDITSEDILFVIWIII